MNCLIFDLSISGHHLEYLHHYYEGARKETDNKYIFVIPSTFESVKDNYVWEKADNISFDFISQEEVGNCFRGNVYIQGYKISKLLAFYVKRYKANRVIATMLTQLIPFAAFLVPSYCKVVGIIYSVYLYNQNELSRARRLAEKTRLWIAARSRTFNKVFILNDCWSAERLNRYYKTAKFMWLPDPVPQVDKAKLFNLRDELKISPNDKIYLHFGGLDSRKGTLDILEALLLADKGILSEKVFIFAGKVSKEIKDSFYGLKQQVDKKCRLLVFDKFCSYEFLYNLCFTADVILMPYHKTNLSSGVLGYASVFEKPVIGPSDGLIGRLIKENKMGYCLENVNPDEIMKATMMPISRCQSDYAMTNSADSFISIVIPNSSK